MATITTAGAVPSTPAQLNAELVSAATALSPGLTTTLPASLIEDLSSTGTGALIVQDQAYVDLINSVSPLTANPFILNQLGAVYGVQQGVGSNTSVYVTFAGTPGFVINIGFVVSDGTYQYTVQDGGIISSSGSSAALYCLAIASGSWAVPIGSVTQIITSVPSTINLTCDNTVTGIPGATAQTTQQYQAQVIQAGLAVSTGMTTLLKTTLGNVNGVQPRLISVVQQSGGWKVVVGGGDPYAVANAIFTSLFNINNLQDSNAFTGVGSISGTLLTITSVSVGSLSIGSVIFGTGILAGTYISSFGSGSGGTGTYNLNISQAVASNTITTGGVTETIAINNFPDTYNIKFVIPVQQTVGVQVTWETVASSNFINPNLVTAAVQPAMTNYINNISVGQPISVLALGDTFQTAVASFLPTQNIATLTFSVTINGIIVAPSAGTVLIYGQAGNEGYFYTTSNNITFIH